MREVSTASVQEQSLSRQRRTVNPALRGVTSELIYTVSQSVADSVSAYPACELWQPNKKTPNRNAVNGRLGDDCKCWAIEIRKADIQKKLWRKKAGDQGKMENWRHFFGHADIVVKIEQGWKKIYIECQKLGVLIYKCF